MLPQIKFFLEIRIEEIFFQIKFFETKTFGDALPNSKLANSLQN